MKVNDMFPSNYMKKEDVPFPTTVVIKSVTQDEIKGDDGKELKAVLSFVGSLKPMILNKSNATSIADVYGEETSAWPGKTIEIYTDPSIMFQGKRVGGVRVRVPQRAAIPPSQNGTTHEMWDVSDGQNVIWNKSSDEVRAFLANCSGPIEQIKMKPAGTAKDQAKTPDEWGFVVAVGGDVNAQVPF